MKIYSFHFVVFFCLVCQHEHDRSSFIQNGLHCFEQRRRRAAHLTDLPIPQGVFTFHRVCNCFFLFVKEKNGNLFITNRFISTFETNFFSFFSFKVMKPMLERKRRARINRCLDELKELMSSALASEGENLTKLEKADVLELTVRHLHKLRERQALGLSPSPSSPASTQDKFRAGFTHCAAEVSRYLATSTGLDVTVGQRLLSHLGRCVHQLEAFPASGATIPSASYTPPSSPTQQQQSELRSIHRSSVLPPLPVSPALSDVMDTTGPCDYSKYSIRSDLYSPSVATASEKVWRPW